MEAEEAALEEDSDMETGEDETKEAALEKDTNKEDRPGKDETEIEEKTTSVGWQETPFDTWIEAVTTGAEQQAGDHWTQLTRADIIVKQQHDPTLQPLIAEARGSEESLFQMEDGLLMRAADSTMGEKLRLIVIPKELRKDIFTMAHALPYAGHLGKRRTAERIAKYFYWPGLG